MKYFSVFSGVGGFELAINNIYGNNNVGRVTSTSATEDGRGKPLSQLSDGIGWGTNATCAGFSEIDKYAISVYRYHYQSHKNYGDITKIDWATVPDFDLLVGGSPCQDFSIAGKREGITGSRSGLVWEYIRCLEEKKPANFIWENVKGVMSSRRGFDFGSILTAFSEAGYDCEWQVLNARDFGVPQNRERIFVVGHLRGKSRPKVFPLSGSNKQITQEQSATAIDQNYWKGPENHGQRTQIAYQNKISWRVRRLTPLECERLMSWPDDWTKTGTTGEISDTQRYKMCGNGVVSKVVEAIIERLDKGREK